MGKNTPKKTGKFCLELDRIVLLGKFKFCFSHYVLEIAARGKENSSFVSIIMFLKLPLEGGANF